MRAWIQPLGMQVQNRLSHSSTDPCLALQPLPVPICAVTGHDGVAELGTETPHGHLRLAYHAGCLTQRRGRLLGVTQETFQTPLYLLGITLLAASPCSFLLTFHTQHLLTWFFMPA